MRTHTTFGIKTLEIDFILERGTCIKGLFWPPLEQKTEDAFHQFYLVGLLEEKPKCKILTFILLLPVAMVTKMADKIGLK